MEIIETPVFTKRITSVLTDEEYRELQWALIVNPKAGDVIKGGRGLRKIRWQTAGKGKRGGLRVIYYVYTRDEKIYMLLPFEKSDQEDLTKEQLKILVNVVKDGVL
jgi:mRNA-degrading endonuclease RelE of RelBE toxin-antitoxin system